MNKQNKLKQVFGIALATFLLTIFLCGCSENISITNGSDLSKFIGTWTGNMEYSMPGFRQNNTPWNFTNPPNNNTSGNFTDFGNSTVGNFSDFIKRTTANITELEFTEDTVYMTITTGNETQTISQTYSLEGDQLVLSFQFTGEGPSGMQPPSGDGERPPFNGEPPSDDERPPFDGEPPSDGERSFMGMSYTYSFNEDNTILYLNGSEFVKIS